MLTQLHPNATHIPLAHGQLTLTPVLPVVNSRPGPHSPPSPNIPWGELAQTHLVAYNLQ
jgi:hypothetical protein